MKEHLPGAPLESFTEIEVFGDVLVLLKNGEKHKIELLGPEDKSIMYSINQNKLTVFGGATHSISELGLKMSKDYQRQSALQITMPRITYVQVREFGHVFFLSTDTTTLDIVSLGSSNISGKIICQKLSIHQSGRDNQIILEGSAGDVQLYFSEQGLFDGHLLECDSIYLNIKDAATASVVAVSQLIIEASGLAGVEYNKNVHRIEIKATEKVRITERVKKR